MRVKEGVIPTALGAIVTAGALAARARDPRGMKKKDMVPMVETAILGFGLAHIVLGTIDLIQDR